MRRAGGIQDIAPRTSARVNKSAGAQFFPRGQITITSLTLQIWTKVAVDARSFIPSQAEPSQIVKNRFTKIRPTTIAIKILNPQNEHAIIFSGAFLCTPESHGVTEMQIACRRRREPAAIAFLCHDKFSKQ
jgi:hypothetical protein